MAARAGGRDDWQGRLEKAFKNSVTAIEARNSATKQAGAA